MSPSGPIPPTNPFHIARAYGVPPVRSGASSGPAASVRPSATDQQPPAAGTRPVIRRIVGAVVPGGVDFSGPRPEPAAGALPFYQHPADENAAAVAVHLGRSIDVSG